MECRNTMNEMKHTEWFADSNPDIAIKPKNESLVIESHGSTIYGRLLLPAFKKETDTCPVVLMLHGYPGTEQNIDIAQSLRMAGFAVLYFSYRGVWGSHGFYSFSHAMEDAQIIFDYINENASRYRLDSKRIYLLGHSVGGFVALSVMAAGLTVKGAVIMAPSDVAYKYLYDKPAFAKLMASQQKGYFTTTSETALEEDVQSHAEQWLFTNLVKKLDIQMPYYFIGGTLDKQTPPEVYVIPVLLELQAKGACVEYTEIYDGHTFPSTRVCLTSLIISFLCEMERKE